MALYAILHTATRVVRRQAIADTDPAVAADETAVELTAGPLALGGGQHWELGQDGVTLTAAPLADVIAAAVDPVVNAQQRQLRIAALAGRIDDALADATLPPKLKLVLSALKAALS